MEKTQRTISQNRALHLAFTQISTELVGQGIDVVWPSNDSLALQALIDSQT